MSHVDFMSLVDEQGRDKPVDGGLHPAAAIGELWLMMDRAKMLNEIAAGMLNEKVGTATSWRMAVADMRKAAKAISEAVERLEVRR